MTRQEQLNEAWCKYMGKCSTEIMQALAFALRWCDAHPHWISVEDELPKDDKWVLGFTAFNAVEVMRYCNGDWWDTMANGVDPLIVTHWMAMPQRSVVSKTETTASEKPTYCGEKGGSHD